MKFVVLERNPAKTLPNGNTLGFDHWRATCISDDEQYARDWAECGRDADGVMREKRILKSADENYIQSLYGKFITDEDVVFMRSVGEFV